MDEELIQIEGTVQSIVFNNPENGYCVIRLESAGGIVMATGIMPGVEPGETLLLTGAFMTHAAYGEQFKSEFIERREPSGGEAIYIYLSSGAIRGIGPKKARDIVDSFGDATLSVIRDEPERLSEVTGITRARALEIGEWYRRRAGLRRLIEFLSEHGVRPAVAVRLYKLYGDDAREAVRDNPYILTSAEVGADFVDADRLALDLGFEPDCPERVEAAVIFELTYNLNNGHSFLPYGKLIAATDTLIGAGEEAVEEAVLVLSDCGSIARQAVAGQDAVYLMELYDAERSVAERLSSMASVEIPSTKDVGELIAQVEAEQGVIYAPAQRKAVELASRRQIFALTGGPGTGKTTGVRGILKLFNILGLKTLLCAPTGRAAKRMSELCMKEASTIHRMLEAGIAEGGELCFERGRDNPLTADAVIVDESSMVDISLMASLLDAMRPDCRLVLVGDKDQLPSVGPGNVFADIIRSGAVETVRLTEIFRQAGGSAIIRSAHMINSGEMPNLAARSGDMFFLKRALPERVAETVTELVSKRLPENMGIEASQIQVLTPTRRYETGTYKLNARLQEAVNPPSPGKREHVFGDFTFRCGDKVMQIRNNYDIIWKTEDFSVTGTGVYNGDIGVICDISGADETVTVDYEDKLVTYQFDQLGELEPAYAMTIHKSQGSEYRAVVLAVSKGAPQLQVRSVLYTAVTRAKELLVIVGDEETVRRMVENDRSLRRYSGLRARLAHLSDAVRPTDAD